MTGTSRTLFEIELAYSSSLAIYIDLRRVFMAIICIRLKVRHITLLTIFIQFNIFLNRTYLFVQVDT